MTKSQNKKSKKPLIITIIIIILLAGGVGIWWWLTQGKANNENLESSQPTTEPIYSNFTGLEIANASLNNSPTYCVQIPNGSTDGARPQAGLNAAGVVFEAIAETGITRFAAVFQNPEVSVIGPIRSLRPYYLDWDTPFDCTVVHDGGSQEALQAIASGGQRNLDENFQYMWREDNPDRLWNNVFTSPSLLNAFNTSMGYTSSSPKTFPRLTPDAVQEIINAQTPCATSPEDPNYNASCTAEPALTSANFIRTAFSNLADYIINYTYDPATNKYLRAYEYGGAHMTYTCDSSLEQPSTSSCELQQVAPSSIAIMRVHERTMSDNYHEEITTISSGEAYVFQNGTVIKGSWQKSSQNSQIKFTDTDGETIAFTPGQLWIAAIPQFGSVSWE